MKKTLLLAVGLYIASTAVTFGSFTLLASEKTATPSDQQLVDQQQPEEVVEETLLDIDPKAPKDQVCPLNGQMYTEIEKEAWEKRRPLAVMIENSPDARPQSGLIKSDVVFEAIAEGGVTRFMAMYYCDAQRQDVIVAPVRSARTYFVDWASGFNRPLYVHVGGANTPGPANALGQLGDYGWNGANDINQFSVGYPTFKRDYNRVEGKDIATEHTMVSSTEKLWVIGEDREWTATDPKGKEWAEGFTPWEFVDGEAGKGSVLTVSFEFWDGFKQFAVQWAYDKTTNSYKRTLAGEPHTDLETGKQIEVKNAVVLFSKEKGPIDELKHMLYQTTGTGTAVVFQNGEALEVNWSKPKRESPLVFTDKKGKPFGFVRGKIWISVVNVGTDVSY